MSEQQFAASLETGIGDEKPQFVLDSVTESGGEASRSADSSQDAPSIGDGTGELRPRPLEAPVLSETTSLESAPRPTEEPNADWRDQVNAKVNHYKARKPRQERYPSLALQFDTPPPRTARAHETFLAIEAGPQTIKEPDAPQAIEMDFSYMAQADSTMPVPPPSPPPRILLEATARVLEFPRPASRADELADPVIDRPRIVEAPELLPPPPAMGGILIEEQQAPEPERRPGFEIPLQSASLRRRAAAGAFDAGLAILAVALFAYVVARMNGSMPPRSAAPFALGLMGAIWPAYQYAFLVFCGKTPGLWLTRLQVSRFDGQPASRRLRRWRVLASVLSLAPLGLGYAWCFLDEDQLTWHDRITRTHLGP